MASSPSRELGRFYSQLKFLLKQQAQTFSLYSKLKHTLAGGGMEAESCTKKDKSTNFPGRHEMSRWKKVDSRTVGVEKSMIPESPWLVLKLLRNKGFNAYLVGGCVRDLLLNKVPKDFDVITTANLKKIRKIFHNAHIVGRRFPICMVNIKGSVVEVSSFETVAKHSEQGENTQSLEVPNGYNKLDYIRWRDSRRRDYTINSLFYDPFSDNIFDYANGMKHLSSSKLKTLIPAEVSFKEDCARILRGLRIAARLGLSFSKDTKTAISSLSFSVKTLSTSRLMMELNYMFSYGAAEPSILLLRKFKLLEFLLPIQDAYLKEQHRDEATGKSVMLIKLLSSLDQVVSCDKPCDCTLWIGLLAFHQSLVASPQDASVLWTLASMLYHGDWSKALKAAREHEWEKIEFEPEISKTDNDHQQLSDDDLVERVSKFAFTVQDSIRTFCNSDSLANAMKARYPSLSCSGLVLVPKKASGEVARIFDVLLDRASESHGKAREHYEVNYSLLVKGNVFEKRFVMGKVIMDTMSNGVLRGGKIMEDAKIPEKKIFQLNDEKREGGSADANISEEKNHQLSDEKREGSSVDAKIFEEKNHQLSDEKREGSSVDAKISEEKNHQLSDEKREGSLVDAKISEEKNHQLSDEKREGSSVDAKISEMNPQPSDEKRDGEKVHEDLLDKLVGRMMEKSKKRKRKQIDEEETEALKKGKVTDETEALKKGKVTDETVIDKKNIDGSKVSSERRPSTEGNSKKRKKTVQKDGLDKKSLKKKEKVSSNEMKSAPKVDALNVSKKSNSTKKTVVANNDKKTQNSVGSLSSLFK